MMREPPWISIVVPSYNQAQFLELTLCSLLDQGEPGVEIIVVDGGSTDGSVEIIKRYADRLAWWVSEPDRGQSHALNKGFAQARGEWLGWLNSDDLLLPGALKALREHSGQHTDKSWWIGGGYFINDSCQRFRDYASPVGLTQPDQLNDWSTYWFAQPSTFFKRDFYGHAGGVVREDLHYAMDLDLWLRLLKLAAPGFINVEISVYRLHGNGKTLSMAVTGETEIVRVLIEHLGLDVALARVHKLALEQDKSHQTLQRLQCKLWPLFALNNAYRRILERIKQGCR